MSEEKMREELNSMMKMAALGVPLGFSLSEDDLMAWALRWSGRPSMEQLDAFFWNHRGDTITTSNPDRHFWLTDQILALYPAPPVQKRVSRDQIRFLHERWWPGRGWSIHDPKYIRLVDDLLALFEHEEEKPSWCEHMVKGNQLTVGEWGVKGADPSFKYTINYSKEVGYYKFCPICSAPRPA